MKRSRTPNGDLDDGCSGDMDVDISKADQDNSVFFFIKTLDGRTVGTGKQPDMPEVPTTLPYSCTTAILSNWNCTCYLPCHPF